MTNNGGNDTIAAVTAMGYDAYYVALEALKAAGSTDPAAVKAALPGVTYTGVSGAIAFDEQGDAIRDTAYIKTADTANNAVDAGDGPDRGINACHFGQPGGGPPARRLVFCVRRERGRLERGRRPALLETVLPTRRSIEEKKGESLWNTEFPSCCPASRWAGSTP